MAKKSFTKNLKKKIISGVIAFGLGLSCMTGLVFAKPTTSVYAEQKESIVENYNFKNTSSSSIPPSPSNWSKITDTTTNSEEIVSGVFSSYQENITNDEKYLDNFKLLTSPGHASENMPSSETKDTEGLYKSLMINSPKYNNRMGYESNTFTLNADSYYVVSVRLKTVTSDNPADNTNYAEKWDSRASFYLVDKSDSKIIDEFTMIDSNNSYETYEMYVATNEFESPSASLQLYLGGKNTQDLTIGAVFFNSASVNEISRDRYLEQTKQIDEVYTSVVDLRDGKNYSPVTNASFDNNLEGWTLSYNDDNIYTVETIKGETFSNSMTAKNLNLTNVTPYTNNSSLENNKSLFMHLSEGGHVSVTSTPITIKQHGYYKISVWAWCNAGQNVTPSIILHDENEKVDDVSVGIASTISTTNASLTNYWTQYSFYVYGSAYADNSVTLTLKLNTTDTDGYVFFDEVTLQELSSTNHSNGQSSGTNGVMTFNPDSTLYNVKNYEFDATLNEDSTITYPLAPKNWKANIDEDNMIGGVINTQESHFNNNSSQYAINNGLVPSNPGYVSKLVDNETSNNILMIGSDSSSVSGNYTTEETFTLSASKTYKISLLAHAANGGLGVKVYTDEYYIFNRNDISCSEWQTIEIYVSTGINTEDVYVQLSLNNTSGYAYFDCVKIEESSNDEYTSSNATLKYIVDLTSINFDNTLPSEGNFEGLNFFTVNQNANNVKVGLVDLSTGNGYYGIMANNSNDKYALVIDSDENVFYNLSSSKEYALTKDSFYKISVWVKTVDVNNGAYIAIDGEGVNHVFKKINTKVDDVTNKWKEYTFFIKATSDTNISIILGLGDSENPSYGIALFDNITFTSIENEETFNESISGKDGLDNVLVINNTDSTEPENENDSDDDTLSGNFNWAIIPSLITALALLIALIGTLLKKVNWKKHTKVKTTYDRRKTLEKDMDRRERIALRNQIIAELNDQLAQIDREIEEYKAVVDQQEKIIQEKVAEQQRAYIEKKQAITAEKEQLLHERNEKLAKDKKAYTEKAEAEFNAYIKKLETQEEKQQKIIASKEIALKQLHAKVEAKLANYIARKERIKAEIARIDAEIEEIAKEEAKIWEEYKQAKAEAKRQKAEYKAQLKKEKEEKLAKKKKSENTPSDNNEQKVESELKSEEVEIEIPDNDNKEN